MHLFRTPRQVSIDLMYDIAFKHGVTYDQLIGPMRTNRLVKARREAAVRLRNERQLSYPQIARYLHRDPSTITNLLSPLVNSFDDQC